MSPEQQQSAIKKLVKKAKSLGFKGVDIVESVQTKFPTNVRALDVFWGIFLMFSEPLRPCIAGGELCADGSRACEPI